MSSYKFKLNALALCEATKASTVDAVQEFSFCIQVHEEEIVTDIFMSFPCNGMEYDVHASAKLDVLEYLTTGIECKEPVAIEINDRDMFNLCYDAMKEMSEDAEVVLEARNDNDDGLFDKVVLWDVAAKKKIGEVGAEEVNEPIPVPEDYTEINEDAEIHYMEDAPEEILFFSKRVPGYWISTTLSEPGSISELNIVRGGIERENAQVIEGDNYIMPKAKRGRRQAKGTPTQETTTTTPEETDGVQGNEEVEETTEQVTEETQETAEGTTETVEADNAEGSEGSEDGASEGTSEGSAGAPDCKACGGTGKNSKGNDCICMGRTNKAPTKAPAPPAMDPVDTPPAPEATTKPPLTPSTEGTQETAPGTAETTDAPPTDDGGKAEKKKPKRRSKEQIRQDAIDKAFQILTDEQGAEDVTDRLEEFCKSLLQSRGYNVERAASTDEALTLQEVLGGLADDLDSVMGKLVRTKDGIRAAQASSEGLTTKEELLAKLAAAL